MVKFTTVLRDRFHEGLNNIFVKFVGFYQQIAALDHCEVFMESEVGYSIVTVADVVVAVATVQSTRAIAVIGSDVHPLCFLPSFAISMKLFTDFIATASAVK